MGSRARARNADRLRGAVVGDGEVCRGQAGDGPAGVEHEGLDAHDVDAGLELEERAEGADRERGEETHHGSGSKSRRRASSAAGTRQP